MLDWRSAVWLGFGYGLAWLSLAWFGLGLPRFVSLCPVRGEATRSGGVVISPQASVTCLARDLLLLSMTFHAASESSRGSTIAQQVLSEKRDFSA